VQIHQLLAGAPPTRFVGWTRAPAIGSDFEVSFGVCQR